MSDVPQNMQALQIANEVRFANAKTRRRLEALPKDEACELAAELLTTDESQAFEAMTVTRLICSIHRFGSGRARQALAAIGVSRVDKRIGELTPRQRCALADRLRDRSPMSEEEAA